MCDYKVRKKRGINHKWIEAHLLRNNYEENYEVFTYFCKKLDEGLRIKTAIKETKMRYPNIPVTAKVEKLEKEKLTVITVG